MCQAGGKTHLSPSTGIGVGKCRNLSGIRQCIKFNVRFLNLSRICEAAVIDFKLYPGEQDRCASGVPVIDVEGRCNGRCRGSVSGRCWLSFMAAEGSVSHLMPVSLINSGTR